MRDTPTIRVKERNGMQLDGSVFDLEAEADVQRVEIDISMRQHYTFWIRAGAAGIEKLGQGVFVDGSDVGAMGRGRREKSVVVARVEPKRLGRAIKLDEHFYRAQILAK